MRGGSSAPGHRASRLDRDDRHAPADAVRDPDERCRVRDRLEVQQDHVGRGLVFPVAQEVVGRHVGSVSDRHEGRDAEAPRVRRVEHGEPNGTRLAQQVGAAGGRQCSTEGGVEPPVADATKDSRAVGSHQAHPPFARDRRKVRLTRRALRPDFCEPGRYHAHRPDAEIAGLGHHVGDRIGRHADDDEIGRDRAGGEIRERRDAAHLRMMRVDGQHDPAETAVDQIAEQESGDRRRVAAGTDDCDRAWGAEAVERRANVGQAFVHPTSLVVPGARVLRHEPRGPQALCGWRRAGRRSGYETTSRSS